MTRNLKTDKPAQLNVRVGPALLRRVEAAATEEQLSISEWVRRALEAAARATLYGPRTQDAA